MTSFPAEWVRPKPGRDQLRIDVLLALVLAVGAATTALLYARTGLFTEPAPVWVSVVGLGLCSLPLAARRIAPIPVAIVVSIAYFVCGQFAVPEQLMGSICLFIALYTVGAWERNRVAAAWTLIGASVGIMTWLVISLIISSSDEDAFPGMPRTGLFSAFATYAAIGIITNLLYLGGAFWFGQRAWRAARTQAMLESQGRELELERQTSAAQAVALDRIAIARELHDVVAHHVSVMGIQSAAARRSLERDPDRAASSLGVVEESAHTAVTELHRLVHTLRSPENEAGASTVGIAHLATLVAESQGAGVPTTLIVAGEARPVPMLADIALYRIAQEALTNVRKHAGRGAEATVRLRFGEDAIEVEISDDGLAQRLVPTTRTGPGGLGLRGMRERIGAVGGTVWSGDRERGGFLVRASVPLTAMADPGGELTADGAPPAGHSAASADVVTQLATNTKVPR